MYTSNEQIARRVYRSLKTPSDTDRRTDPILAFHFKGKNDYIMMRCNKELEISIKGAGQDPGEVKFFAYSDFKDFEAEDVLFRLQEQVNLIELYARGSVRPMTFKSWVEFEKWLDTLDDNGVQISLKLPCLVYRAVKNEKPSMQNFIVESIKRALRDRPKSPKAVKVRGD